MTTEMKRIALVTGSTSGIGKAIAEQLAKDGVTVITNSFGEKAENQNGHLYLRGDISKRSDIERLRDEITSRFGRLDYLVANAGIMPKPCGIEDITEENIDKTINLNLKGTFWTLKIFPAREFRS